MVIDVLLSLGFSQREVNVYLSLNSRGSARASDLAKELQTPKTTIIEALYALEEKGLVSKTPQKNSYIFHAEDPDILIQNIERKELKLQETKKRLKKVLPQLKTLKKNINLPEVRYFQGKEGIIQLYEDTLKSKSRIYAYGSSEDEMKYLEGYFPGYWDKRVKAKVSLTALMPATEYNQKFSQKTDNIHLRDTKLFPKEYRSPLEIDVYDDKVVLMSFQEMIGVMIRSQVIANAMRNILKMVREGIQ